MSQTQGSNFLAFAGVLVLLLQRFDIVISENDALTIISAIVTLGSIGYNYWNRFNKGDVTPLGFIKK